MPILETILAGSLLAAFLQVLFDRLSSQDFIHFVQGDESVYELIKKLKVVLSSINSLINDAEEKQLTNRAIRDWFAELDEAIHDAEDLVDEINTRALESSTSKVRKIISDPFLGTKRKIEKTIDRLEFIARQKENLGLREGGQARSFRGSPPATLADRSGIRGRDDDIKAILEVLESNDVRRKKISVISIVGMGGIGKSTLAQIVYDKAKSSFDCSAWISVCGEFDVFMLTQAIFEAVTSRPCHITDLYNLQSELVFALGKKKFFFVLDDVWNENYILWDALKTPFEFAACGSTIIVTTRNENVASRMSSVLTHQLQKISDEDSWCLFEKHALDNVDLGEHPDLENIGRKIVRKCGGLPLAIKSLGGLLRFELNTEEWEKILDSNIWELTQEHNILPVLWLSYYHLPPHLKRCFAYCSIFSKNYQIEKEQLVLLWMAEGLLQSQRGRRIEDVGEEYLHALVSRSLFQHSSDPEQSFVTMHDLVHDLAIFVSREFCQRVDDDDSHVVSRKIRHLSFTNIEPCKVIEKFKQFVQPKRSCLRTFLSLKKDDNLLRKNLVLPEVPRKNRLRVLALRRYPIADLPLTTCNLKHLRYFDLFCAKIRKLPDAVGELCNLQTLLLEHCSELTRLPDSIGDLKHLRYLNLSSTGIKELPDSVCCLCNLQTLLLKDCVKLTRLPTSMEHLTSLRHLNIQGTSLVEMPPNMRKLKGLQILTDFMLGNRTGSTIIDLGELQHLQGCLTISELENIDHSSGDVSGNNILDNKKYLNKLLLKWKCCTHYSLEEGVILEKLQPHKNLQQLSIECYNGGGFPRWVGDVSFSKMVQVNLINCKHCFKLPPLGKLPSLRTLYIEGFDQLEEIGAEFYSGDDEVLNPFKSLETLYFVKMERWQNWSLIGAEGRDAFPSLKTLCLDRCRKLDSGLLPDRLLRLLRD